MHNYKFICLECHKTFKGYSKCCGHQTYNLGYKARMPKKNGRKSDWKEFVDRFIWARPSISTTWELEKIIKWRKEYGLDTDSAELNLDKLKNKKEPEKHFLDISADEELFTIYDYSYDEEHKAQSVVFKQINEFVTKSKKNNEQFKFKNTEKIWFVPLHINSFNCLIFPKDSKRFDIIKGVALNDGEYFKYLLHTDDGKVEIKRETLTSRTSCRQGWIVFNDEMRARAFRAEYLNLVIPKLKELGSESYSQELVKSVNIDYGKVIKKAPQLLV